MKTIVVGVMPQEQIRARAIAIAKGEYKPKPGEPKIWFASMKSVAEVLSDQNRALLKVIRETKPDSMAVLARATGRQAGNLSRTLKTMSRYGLVDLQREKTHVRPVVTADWLNTIGSSSARRRQGVGSPTRSIQPGSGYRTIPLSSSIRCMSCSLACN